MQYSAAVVQEVGAPFTLTDVDLEAPAPAPHKGEVTKAVLTPLTALRRSRRPTNVE